MAAKKKSELLQYGISAIPDATIYKTKASQYKARIRALYKFFNSEDAEDESDFATRGVQLIGRWRNPNNKKPEHANWKTTEMPGQSLEDFRETLYGQRGALRELAEHVSAEWQRLNARTGKAKGLRKKTNAKTGGRDGESRKGESRSVARKSRSKKTNETRKSRNRGTKGKRK